MPIRRFINTNSAVFTSPPTLLLRSLLLISVCLLIAYRQPLNLIEPRFWCEEGTYFFSYAYSHSWYETLFHIVPHLGYYSLVHNLASMSATFVSLEQAPFVTTYLGFFSHVLPCFIVIFGNSRFWDTAAKKIFICLGILFFPFGAMWLTTTYIHFTLALNVFLILLENMEQSNRLTKNLYRLLILLGGFSGAVTCFLTPVFFLKAWRSRLKEDIIQTSLLVFASVVQVVIIIFLLASIEPGTQSRFVSFGFNQLWGIIFFQFGIPFYGHSYFNSDIIRTLDFKSFYAVFAYVYPFLGKASSIFQMSATLLSVLLVMAYSVFVLIKHLGDRSLQLPAFSFLLVFILSSAASVQMLGGWRYAYVPCVILLVMFIVEYSNKLSGVIRKSAAAFFIMLMLLVNGYNYRNSTETYDTKWADEISQWHKDKNHKIRIWRDGWEMTLVP